MSNKLYELAVEGLFHQDALLDTFNELPSEIKEQILPKVIDKLKNVDDYKTQITILTQNVTNLEEKIKHYKGEIAHLNREVERLQAYYKGNTQPPRIPRPPNFPNFPSPDFPEPPVFNIKKGRESRVFTFDINDRPFELDNHFC